ncbi:MAG: PspC domain-containing protein [Lachnospiraceae bacterium]|nr:PspC domain-containing protein [Lachnospiraceae bacterium]
MNRKKRLCKSKHDAQLFGVCGGIAEYFEIDSTIVRLVTLSLMIFAGMSFWVYIIAALVMPDKIEDDSDIIDGTYH